jgi:hypothetical protein
VDILGLPAPKWFFHIEFSTSLTKILLLFIFHIVILLTLCAHTCFILEVNFYFSLSTSLIDHDRIIGSIDHPIDPSVLL